MNKRGFLKAAISAIALATCPDAVKRGLQPRILDINDTLACEIEFEIITTPIYAKARKMNCGGREATSL